MIWRQSTQIVCVLVACVCCVSAASVSAAANFEGSCDVTVWDATADERSVRRVAVQCGEGTITWRSPYGGLHVTFLPPGVRGRLYEVCFLASARYAAFSLSVEHGSTLRPALVVKAPNGTSSESDVDDEQCFRFTRGQHPVTLFAEVDAAMTSLAVGQLTVEYGVRRIADNKDGYKEEEDTMTDCRPCSDDELMDHVCSADFVVDGTMSDVTDSSNHRWTHVLVDVVDVVHQSNNFVDFTDRRTASSKIEPRRQSSMSGTRRMHHLDANPLPVPPLPAVRDNGKVVLTRRSPRSGRSVVVSIPAVCQVHKGRGQFLFVGHVHLKRSLRIACAPRSDEFWKLWNAAVDEGRNPCILNS